MLAVVKEETVWSAINRREHQRQVVRYDVVLMNAALLLFVASLVGVKIHS